MSIIKLIQQKYGDSCQLCSPLDKKQYNKAREMLPVELLEILEVSNGIEKLVIFPDVNDGKPFVMDNIVYSFDEIKSETESFFDLHGDEGTVFAGNGAGGFFVLKPDGTVYLIILLNYDLHYYGFIL